MTPLANGIRPTNLDQILGQTHLVGENGVIRNMLNTGNISSMIFWGQPATGKTTLARIIADASQRDFYTLSAVMDGKSELKKILSQIQPQAKPIQSTNLFIQSSGFGEEMNFKPKTPNKNLELHTAETEANKSPILFIDEIHRWSKTQQDALLPYVEAGDLVLIGATTENPSFTIVNALLSRTQVIVFYPLQEDEIIQGLYNGLQELNPNLEITAQIRQLIQKITQNSNSDLRFALNQLETLYHQNPSLDFLEIPEINNRNLNYDKNGEEHYNLISAVHKSIRSSNPTAGTYWVVRMLEAGEDPLYIARRLLRFASEDIGNSNPTALLLANQVFEACQKLGMPECSVHLVQLVEYLARSSKNNSAYLALQKAQADVQKFQNLPVPKNLLNAPTKLMKNLGYGQGYEYDHNLPGKKSKQQLLPDELLGRDYYSD